MFGTYRLLLAVIVMVSHLVAGYGSSGHFAVFGFYTLSGYLMTLILQEKYGYTAHGRIAYCLNRFLRIFPPYWLCAGFTVLLIVVLFDPASVAAVRKFMILPRTATEMFQNIFLVLTPYTPSRLVPPAWALSIELFYYILIGLGITRNRKVTVVFFLVGFGYTVYSLMVGASFFSRLYAFVPAAALPFSVGGLLYHYRVYLLRWLPVLKSRLFPVFAGVPMLLVMYQAGNFKSSLPWLFFTLFYLNLVINAFVVLSLSTVAGGSRVARKADSLLGDYSYPVYLIHWQGAFLAIMLFPTLRKGSLMQFLVGLVIIFALATLVMYLVERPVDYIRKYVQRRMVRRVC
jgi:peptidoglycan/LPS O-acetylase OafA/YrhL